MREVAGAEPVPPTKLANSMIIIKTPHFTLRPLKKGDEESLAKNINNKKIYQATLRIPYPYTLKNADKWINECLKEYTKEKPKELVWVIDINSEVCGSIGLEKIEGHKAEIGFWLAEKCWNKGIMTEAVKRLTEFGFKKLKLRRIYAYVFLFNKASMRVLEKAGFEKEGLLRKDVEKDGRLMDDYIFAKVVD